MHVIPASLLRARHDLGVVMAACVALASIVGCAGGGARMLYEGTYMRTWVELDGSVEQQSGPVRLVLAGDGDYEVEGERYDLPPKGRGHYTRLEDGTLVLDDRAFATAGFDLSLILEGPFQAAEEGTSLVLTQENLWGHTHHLVLERVSPGNKETGGP